MFEKKTGRIEFASIQTKPDGARVEYRAVKEENRANRIRVYTNKTRMVRGLNTYLLVRGGGHRLCSREFYSPGNGDFYNPN